MNPAAEQSANCEELRATTAPAAAIAGEEEEVVIDDEVAMDGDVDEVVVLGSVEVEEDDEG
jgi:hypothetical protein